VNAANYGHVHGRYDGKAVCAFLDGSVRILSIEELRDMRLWSRKAALENNPNYQPK
jgi:prepilin-type processing-associated H-X9-DG protein